MNNNNILRALSEKSFLYLWLGEIFTVLAANIFNFFLILVVYNLVHSSTAVSGVVLSFTVPAILFGLLAGGYVDRWNKKMVLLVTNILRACLLIILIFNIHNLVMIYIISFLVSILTQFFIPAEIPIIPHVVQKNNLLPANALFSMAIFGTLLVAYTLTGPLIIYFKYTYTLLLLAAMFLIGAFFIFLIRLTDKQISTINKKVTTTSVVQDLKETVAYISKTRKIYNSVLLLALTQILILILATIAPGYASQILGIHVEEFPLLFVAPAALGTVVGAIGIANIFHNHPKEKVITTGIMLSGLAMLFLPYGSKVASREFIHTLNVYLPHIVEINILHIMVFLAFLLGVANSMVFVPANTLIQEETPDESRGKIYGVLNTIIGIASLLPIIMVGGLSDIIGVGAVIVGIGIALLLFGVLRIIIK